VAKKFGCGFAAMGLSVVNKKDTRCFVLGFDGIILMEGVK